MGRLPTQASSRRSQSGPDVPGKRIDEIGRWAQKRSPGSIAVSFLKSILEQIKAELKCLHRIGIRESGSE
jgi:hypothetical protein